MKKIIKIVALFVSLICMISVIGCSASIRVEFRQDGEQSKVYFVSSGASIKAPALIQKKGYTTVWDCEDFSTIIENIVINAVSYPNEYTVSYELTDIARTRNVEKTSDTVLFGEAFTPYIPVIATYDFDGWTIKETGEYYYGGLYSFDKDITLVAHWVQTDYTFEY